MKHGRRLRSTQHRADSHFSGVDIHISGLVLGERRALWTFGKPLEKVAATRNVA
jgi:hypothetical protein